MKEKLAVVAVSGGMVSCVTAAIANETYRLAFVHINYGQRTEKRELKAFNDIADFYNVENRMVIDLSHFSKIGGSYCPVARLSEYASCRRRSKSTGNKENTSSRCNLS